ncbi:transcriptional regulator family: Fungal Specific TF [Penicillium lagena]|uniref:transcriptional regulator family: Fungal Specific TF n=1 Tax=Penicillium lagena TaxID=94218 RepID=UPI0025425D13|nr:transcriptional regulator family: Fungal Specific TF [Penicillium lagena]KAJ5623872.1 transcriptional regulator family: Fungal Specific TF [Penicillium lagena]
MSPRSESRGRVSRSCGNCRAIKRRCDRQSPNCGQCIRLGEDCPGYRDEWDLVFRDQTDQTVKRYNAKKTKSATNDSPPPTDSLSPSIDEIGVNYFFCNFVVGGQSSARGCLNYIPTVYRADSEHPTLVASMAAVGLVALANSTQQPELASRARAKYSEAIRNVNIALESPTESVKDSTLMSVISLGVFEHVSGYESWSRHVQGAAALVVARGKRQFSSPVAIRMFNQVRADLVLACVYGAKPFPKDMLELQEEAAKHTDPSSSFWLMGVLSTRCANLLMSVRKNKTTGETPWSTLLDEASVIERDFQYILEVLAVQEPYTTMRESGGDPNMIYNGRFDLYRDFWAIRLWNNLRNLRMIVCEISCYLLNKFLATDLAPAVREHMELKLQMTEETLSMLAHDILATVPQASEYLSSASGSRSSAGLPFQGSVPGGYMLTWGLYMVGKCPITTSETRKWVIQRLQNIGRDTGISIALRLVEHIVKIDQWAG